MIKDHPRVCESCMRRAGSRTGRRGICPESHFDKGKRKEAVDLEERKKLVLALKEKEDE